MSTKIYTAWRVERDALCTAIDDMAGRAFAKAAEQLVKLMEGVKDSFVVEKRAMIPAANIPSGARGNALIRMRAALAYGIVESKSLYRSFGDFDASANVFISDASADHAYIIPYGDCPEWSRWSPPSFFEDFSYWNNTDPPEGMDEAEWGVRRDIWGVVALSDWDRCRYQKTFIDLGSAPMIGVDNILKKAGLYGDDIHGWILSARFDADELKAKTESIKCLRS